MGNKLLSSVLQCTHVGAMRLYAAKYVVLL